MRPARPAGDGRRRGGEAGSARDAARRLLGHLRPYRWIFALGLGATVLAALFDAFSLLLLIPFLRSLFDMGPVLPGGGRNGAERAIDWLVGDWIQAGTELASLRNICLVVLAVLVLKNVFFYGARLASIHVQERVERDLRDRVYAHLQRLPLGFFERTKAGQLIARVLADTREAKGIVSFALSEAVRQAATVLAYLTALLFLSWRLTLLALVLAPLMIGVLRPLLRRLRDRFREVYEEQGELLAVLQETLGGIRLVKAYGAEAHEERRFRERSDRYARELVRTEAIAHLASPLSEVLSATVALGLIWVGARFVLEAGVLGPEQFLAFVTIALRMISPIKKLSQFPARAQAALAASDRFFQVLDATPEPAVAAVQGGRGGRVGAEAGDGGAPAGDGGAPAGDGGAPSGAGRGTGGGAPAAAVREARPAPEREIRFEGVTFAYEPGRPVLRDVDLTVRPGEVVALVGPSGAGKSTLVDLLPRFIEPDAGRVTLDGRDLREIDLSTLRAWMGIVSQETVVFHDTARANIAYGDPGRWTDREVEAAARAAGAHDFLRALPRGYDTVLGERGVRLSGGQRQRIGIARALLRDPPILILDEATSNLDSESERSIQAAMERLLEGRTVFVIAHRLSTVRDADRIVVLDEGRIVQRGTHADLREADGLYRRLHELQLAGGAPPAGSDRR